MTDGQTDTHTLRWQRPRYAERGAGRNETGDVRKTRVR